MDPLSREEGSSHSLLADMITSVCGCKVYTALAGYQETEVESDDTGHQVTICHISKAANKLQPFRGRPPEDLLKLFRCCCLLRASEHKISGTHKVLNEITRN